MSSLLEHSAEDAGQHVVQFYKSDADLIARAGDHLRDGAEAGAVVIVIATEAHREAFQARLREADVDVAAAGHGGTLVLLDAAATLARLMRDGSVDRDAFFDVVGGVVHAAAATGRPVRAYGEMVGLLWEGGDVIAAIDLETLWSELATEIPFSLNCAYRSESVAGPEHAAMLHRVCQLHSAVVPALPVEATWRFAPDVAAAGDARRLLIETLRRAGHHADLIRDAQFVIGELAANAVRHACTPFSVSVRSTDSTVGIRVRDGSQDLPKVRAPSSTMPSGRGMHIISALATRWGADLTAGGKVVWAELGR